MHRNFPDTVAWVPLLSIWFPLALVRAAPGRALALHSHIGDAVARAARGCLGFPGTVPSLSLAQLLHWGPGSCKSFCFGLDSAHSEAVSYLLFHISKRP